MSGNQTQAQIDKKMENLIKEYSMLFKGIGKAKIEPGVYIIPSNLISFRDIFSLKLGKINIFRGGQ